MAFIKRCRRCKRIKDEYENSEFVDWSLGDGSSDFCVLLCKACDKAVRSSVWKCIRSFKKKTK